MSSNDVAVRVRGLSKAYTITHAEKATRADEAIMQAIRHPFRRVEKETFWALKDVDFDIKKGDVVGIIGRNGAGKSTLLKILSRITEPTTGEIALFGRVGSLLEVGTGFHPELTGRENVYLNGAILGMKRREIERHFDAIVDFAGVEQFLDTPVKRYSSGMYVRLAFAVAAHLNPEILIVDEVLAVGDAEFQKKCLGKMGDVAKSGRTVLFVSHNMAAIQRLCQNVMLLKKGCMASYGKTEAITQQYYNSVDNLLPKREWHLINNAPGNDKAKFRAIRVLDDTRNVNCTLDISKPFFIEVEYTSYSTDKLTVSIHIINQDGLTLFVSNDFNNSDWQNTCSIPGRVCAVLKIPGNFMAEGRFSILAAVCRYNPNIVHAILPDAVRFEIVDSGSPDGVRGNYTGKWEGVVRPMFGWEVGYVSEDV